MTTTTSSSPSPTIESVLAVPAARLAAESAAAAGKTSSRALEAHAPRRVARAAVARLAARLARRQDRAAADGARAAAPGRIARLAGERRQARTHDAIDGLCRSLYRISATRWAGGDHEVSVSLGAPAAVGGSHKVWSRNGKWSGSTSWHRITVPADWLATVEALGLAEAGGMLTLSAVPVPGRGDELFEARWVEQGRGFELNLARGYLARRGEVTYHAATARAALAGLARKVAGAPRRSPTLDLDRVVRRHGGLPVTLADAVGVGLCKSGTRSWCRAVGIDPDGPATLAHVVAGYRIRPLAEVLRVVRRVVRDARNRQPLPVDAVAVGLAVAAAGGDEAAAAALADRQAGIPE